MQTQVAERAKAKLKLPKPELPGPGVYDSSELDEKTYHALPYISKSRLDHLDKSPQHLIWEMNNPTPPTPAMTFGSLFHCKALEPLRAKEQFLVFPNEGNYSNQKASSEYKNFVKANPGKDIVIREDDDQVNAMVDAIYSHPLASKLLSGGSAEQSFIFKTKYDFLMKGRADYVKGNVVVDLKTTEDASPKSFKKSVANLRYHVQAAVYSMAMKQLTGSDLESIVFIAIEKKPPYAIGIYVIDDLFVQAGQIALEKNLETYAECLRTDVWSGYSADIVTLEAPPWLGND